jgi:uncharacterized protein with HEPN domain
MKQRDYHLYLQDILEAIHVFGSLCKDSHTNNLLPTRRRGMQ